jgi:prevent-host-death family protein
MQNVPETLARGRARAHPTESSQEHNPGAACLFQRGRPAVSLCRTRVVDFVAICSYMAGMKTVSIRDAKNRLTELAREVERGETVVVTRNGRPAFDLVPHQRRKGLRLEAIDEFKRKHRIKAIVPYIADDFDEPLPEDFLLRSLPVDR